MKLLHDTDTSGWDAFVKESLAAVTSPKEKKKVGRMIVAEFLGRVIPRTPVDTGRARSAWTAASGRVGGVKALGSWIENQGKGDIDAQALGAREGDYNESMARGQFSATITNGVPYITFLEIGSSRQAPSGFVRLTLREMSGQAARDGKQWTTEQLRLANNKARRMSGVRRGRSLNRRSGVVGRL